MLRKLILAVLVAGSSLAAPLASADPPRVAVVQHSYVYYPHTEIYYAPDRQVWYWMADDGWRQGIDLPVVYRQYTTNGVTVLLEDERPFVQHTYVVERYGGKHKKGKKGKHRGRKHDD